MLILITYDVNTEDKAGQKRLRQLAKICVNKGQRVQKSVFECSLDWSQWLDMKNQLLKVIDPACDSLRFYYLGNNWKGRVEHTGANPGYDPEGPLIV